MELKLVTTEKFEELDCNFYRNMNDDILVTREQIGTALEYVDPSKAIEKIHKRYKDRLDKFSVITKLVTTDGKKYNTFLYSEKGIMEICRWSRQPKANDFMDFTWEVMKKILHKNDLCFDYSSVMSEMSSIKNELQSIKYAAIRQQPLKQYSKWKYKTNPKIRLLAEYFNESQLTILRNLYIELEDTYNLDLNEYKDDYCFEMGLRNCSQLDVIENNKDLRDMFDLLVNSLLEEYELVDKIQKSTKRKTIFD
mgnify:CR=1 FL=1